MPNDRIKVPGYAQRVFFNDNIEYRNFSPDLVGLQLASNGGTPLFTMGNFSITTNMEPKSNKTYSTNKFSNFVTLTDLNLSLQQTLTLLQNNAGVSLNLDKSKLTNYALFAPLSEFLRVALEDIITFWPASLYINPLAQNNIGYTITGYTVQNYTYDSLTKIATFKAPTTFINNKFQINYLIGGTIANTFNQNNPTRNLVKTYSSYAVLINDTEYNILGFTGATSTTNDFIYLQVSGNPFSSTTGIYTYHIKPNKTNADAFFNGLPDFEFYLLNRQVVPLYTASFTFPIKSDDGVILYVTDTATWPVSDGYNIDFDTPDYDAYATKLIDIATDSDNYISNLMVRFLVAESISAFDTTPVHLSALDMDTSGQKVNKLLTIYGVEYDDINNFIHGIEFANTVTYNKQDNTPDVYLKNLARVLGWDLVSSVLENDLLKNYVTTTPSTYSGLSVGMTAWEADVELWRRIILNTPWLWKSKGARKSIEFLFKFIGAPEGLIKFNEYIYRANGPIDVELFQQVLALNGLDTDLSLYPIDANGYPNPLPNTPDMYFQNNGLWYRETGGSASTLDILVGNNPHVGPYDGGFKYINQFVKLIPNFSAVTLTSTTVTTGSTNLFTNYNLGTMNEYSGGTFVDLEGENGVDLSECLVVTSSIINSPKPRPEMTDCGCESATDDKSLSICVKEQQNPSACKDHIASISADSTTGLYNFVYKQYDINGNQFPQNRTSIFSSQACCQSNNGSPILYSQVDPTTSAVTNTGYVCCSSGSNNCGCSVACDWSLADSPNTINISGSTYLLFVKPDGHNAVVSFDGGNCISTYTTKVSVTDPYTNKVGIGCQVTPTGVSDLALGANSEIVNFYLGRGSKEIGCCSEQCPQVSGAQLTLTGSIMQSPINNQSNVSLTVSKGSAPYTYNLFNFSTIPVVNITGTINSNTPTLIASLTDGSYRLVVKDKYGISGTAIIYINNASFGTRFLQQANTQLVMVNVKTNLPIGKFCCDKQHVLFWDSIQKLCIETT